MSILWGQGPELLLGSSQLSEEELAPRWLQWGDQTDGWGALAICLSFAAAEDSLGAGDGTRQRRHRAGPSPPGTTPGQLQGVKQLFLIYSSPWELCSKG